MSIPYRKACISNGEGLPALVIYLHGGPRRGDDNIGQMQEKAVKAISGYLEKNSIYSVMIVPQCPSSLSWNSETSKALKGLIQEYIDDKKIEAGRIYLLGGSMGGTGAWLMASSYPDLFAAIMPVAGMPEGVDSKRVAKTPVCAIMGAKDNLMPVSRVDDFVKELKDKGGKVLFCVEEDWGHVKTCEDSYTAERLKWIFSQSR